MPGSPPPVREIAAKGTHAAVLLMLRSEPSVRRVLDVPCGHGAFTLRLRELGYDVVPADIVAPPGPLGSGFLAADMNQRLPFADGALDAVICIDGIEHIERPYDFAAECARIVRPGGVVILSTPNISSLRSRWRWLLTGFHQGRKTPLDERHVDPLHHINLLEFHKLRYMLHRVGLRITAIGTNRTKAIAWLYAPLLPFAWVMTKFVFWQEMHDTKHRDIARDVQRQMFTIAVAFGEALIVKAVRPADGPPA